MTDPDGGVFSIDEQWGSCPFHRVPVDTPLVVVLHLNADQHHILTDVAQPFRAGLQLGQGLFRL